MQNPDMDADDRAAHLEENRQTMRDQYNLMASMYETPLVWNDTPPEDGDGTDDGDGDRTDDGTDGGTDGGSSGTSGSSGGSVIDRAGLGGGGDGAV